MKLKPILFALALLAGLAVAGCGSDDKDAAIPDAASDAATAAVAATAAAPATALPPPPQLNARSFIHAPFSTVNAAFNTQFPSYAFNIA